MMVNVNYVLVSTHRIENYPVTTVLKGTTESKYSHWCFRKHCYNCIYYFSSPRFIENCTSMTAATQKYRPIQIITPLGEDVLLFQHMSGSEGLSQLFAYKLDLLSEQAAIDPEKLLGRNVTIGMQLPDKNWRYFNGYITRFGQHGVLDVYSYYQATVRPWLWFLTRASNCRIFQNKTVPEIIQQVFQDQKFTDFQLKLSNPHARREYCVQYRETDFNFVSRLMEEEGIYYYFVHSNGKHDLILTDSHAGHKPFPGYVEIPYHPEEGQTDRSRTDHIYRWSFSREVQTGVYNLNNYDFEKPKADLLVKADLSKSYPHSAYEYFDYPGEYKDTGVGEQFVRHRIEEHHVQFEQCEGEGNARGLAAGHHFKLTQYGRKDQNRKYLVVSASYWMQLDDYTSSGHGGKMTDRIFTCRFNAIDSLSPYRPARITPKPLMHGTQTAMVVGPKGEEIYTDKYGRIKVQFHWDRYGKSDENSSCWIRVSHPWAGKNWGMIALPRIGHEVVVDFLEGDPDQPIVTGRVYNAISMPPYTLPEKAHLSTIKTYSTKGGGGFNEIRFDDKKGKEQVFIHAERNQDVRVKKDRFEWIGNEQHLIVKKDLFEEVGADSHSTVKGDRNEEITGTLSIKAGMDMQEKVGMKHALDAGMEIHLKAGMNVVIEAGVSITLKAGGGFIVVGPAGVTISGTPVLINSGGAAGSGSGASPHKPKKPKVAADDKAGSKDEPAPKRPPRPATYGPSATVLKTASQNGTPFCQKCEEARRQASDKDRK